MPVKDAIREYLAAHRDEAVQLLRALLRLDTSDIRHGYDGQEEKGQLFLMRFLEGFGAETVLTTPDYERIKGYAECAHGHSYEGRPNLLGIVRGAGGGRSLILNGHMDTMAAGDPAQWKYDPWSAQVEGDTIYSLGACDMKAGLAAMAFALKAVTQHCRLRGDVTLQSVVDEEGGGNGTLDLVAQGCTADAAIIAEPTDLKVMVASRGVLVCHISVSGQASHCNYKWSKANAVEKAFKVWQALNELEHRWLATKTHPLLPRPSITLGKIVGGVAGTAVPASCEMDFDVEFLPEEYDLDGGCRQTSGADIKKELEEALALVCAGDPWLREHPPILTVEQHVEPHSIDPAFPLVEIMARNHGNGVVSAFPAGCDARHLAQGGITTLIYGPGSMKDAHSVNEKVDIRDYLKCIETIAMTLVDWCGTAE